jgi:hypothetical protein
MVTYEIKLEIEKSARKNFSYMVKKRTINHILGEHLQKYYFTSK